MDGSARIRAWRARSIFDTGYHLVDLRMNFLAFLVVMVAIAFTGAMGPTRLFNQKTVTGILLGAGWMCFWTIAGIFAMFQLGLHKVFLDGLLTLAGV